MEVIEKKRNGIYVLAVPGRLDGCTSGEFEAKVFEIIGAGRPNIILDCGDLVYLSSAGLRVILKAVKTTKKSGGQIVLCSVNDYVKEVLKVSGFDTFITIVSNLENALKEF